MHFGLYTFATTTIILILQSCHNQAPERDRTAGYRRTIGVESDATKSTKSESAKSEVSNSEVANSEIADSEIAKPANQTPAPTTPAPTASQTPTPTAKPTPTPSGNSGADETATPKVQIGLGRSNFVWSYEDKVDRRKDRAFADINIMRHANVKIVRTDMRGFANGINDTTEADRLRDVLQRLQEVGMKAIVMISISAFDYNEPWAASAQDDGSGAFKAKCGWTGGAWRMAWINSARFEQRIQMHLDRFKAAGITNIVGFEILNEPDWVCFNGDIWIGGVDSFDPNTITKYAELLKISNKTIKKVYPNAKIVTAGLANIGLTVPNYLGYIYPLNFLKWVNNVKDETGKGAIDAYADAVGVHWYPMDYTNFQTGTRNMLKQVSDTVGGKPIWITEFGVSDYLASDQNARTKFFKDFFVYVRDSITEAMVPMMFAYGLHTPDGHDFVDYKDPSTVGSVPASCVSAFYPAPIPSQCEDKLRPALSIFSQL